MLKKLTVKEFLKNNLVIVLFLTVLLVVSLAVFIIVFWERLYDAGAWGSLVAGLFTYIGSSFLGLVVFYNTQSEQRQKEIEDQIVVQIEYISDFDMEAKCFVPFLDKDIDKKKFLEHSSRYQNDANEASLDNMRYLYYEVTNRNTHIPVYVEPVSIFVFNGKKFVDVGYCSYYSDMNDSNAIDYKQKKCCYIGTNKELLKSDYYKEDEFQLCYLAFRMTSIKDQIQYVACEFFMGGTLGTSRPRFFTEEEIKNRVNKLGTPFYTPMYLKQTIIGNKKKRKENAKVIS